MTKISKVAMKTESIAKRSDKDIQIEDGFFVLKAKNDGDTIQKITREIEPCFIQFHFCVKGASKFIFSNGSYAFDVNTEHSLLLYNPEKDLPINLELQPKSWVVSILLSIKKFHSLFSQESDYIHFLSDDNKEKKYYNSKEIAPAKIVVLNQMMNYNIHPSIEKLYLKAKTYELLSLYFNKTENKDVEQCPFLVNEENVLKIRKAKDIIINRMTDPPSLQELANEIELTLKKLKDGFKQIYGDTVYSFLFNHKMEYARKLLETNQYNINEIGLKVGYSTASHFIAAFKKKYGITPKKYKQ